MQEKICTECGFEGKPVAQCKMSFFVDVALWVTVVNLVFFTGFLPLLLIPTVWTLYHIIKFNSVKCPECESLNMVSRNSRAGKRAIERKKNPIKIWKGDAAQTN